MFFLSAAACVLLMPFADGMSFLDVLHGLGAMAGFTSMGLVAWLAGS
jgi:hypothetical protein